MANTANSLSIFSLLDALRRRKIYVILPVLLLTAGFTFYAYHEQDRYRATAVIAATQTTPPEYLKQVAPPPLNIQDHLWTVREILFSQPVLEAAARQLGQFKQVAGPIPAPTLDEFKADINIKVDSEHSFTVSFDGTDRFEATNVTNKLADLFVEKASANRTQKSQDAADVIDDQLQALKDRLEAQTQQIHSYKQKAVHALPDHIDDNFREAASLREQYEAKRTKIAEEEAHRTEIQKQLQEMESKGLLEQPVIQEKTPDEIKLEELRAKEKELSTRYTGAHPELIQTRKQLNDLESAVADHPKKARTEPTPAYLHYVELKSELDGIDERVQSYRRDLGTLSSQMANTTQQIQQTPQNERVIEDMQREYDVGEKQFHALLDKQLDAKLAKGFEQSETGIAFGIIEPASVPTAPYSPQRLRLILMGLGSGLGLGLLLAFFKEQNDTSFGNVNDFQSFTTLPAIGVVPQMRLPKRKSKPGQNAIITITDPDSVAAEQYRILAMKVQQFSDATAAKALMITSAAGGEGKSLTAINLAMAVASTIEGKVLLVDGDMRKPRISEYLDLNVPGGKGFHEMLMNGDVRTENYVEKVKSIYVLRGNVPSSNPVAALASPKARVLFESLKREFAFIVVDAPPTLPIADCHILSGLCDRVLFVVRARETPRELFQHAVESFEPANLLGAVLNGVDYQRSRYAYAYEYYKKAA